MSTDTNELVEVKKVVGRAVRANYSPMFTNQQLKDMGDALHYMLEYLKNVGTTDKGAYLLNYITTEAKKNLGKIRQSWANLTYDSQLMKTNASPTAKLNKEAIGELTKARRRIAAVNKKAKVKMIGLAELVNA